MIQAQRQNVGTCRLDVKRETQVGMNHECESSDARHRVGVAHSSDEVSVMEMERRSCLVQQELRRHP